MAKVGYIFIATNGEEYAEDKAWMQQYGCVQVIEELSEHEAAPDVEAAHIESGARRRAGGVEVQ